jgi:hypothetical protein
LLAFWKAGAAALINDSPALRYFRRKTGTTPIRFRRQRSWYYLRLQGVGNCAIRSKPLIVVETLPN